MISKAQAPTQYASKGYEFNNLTMKKISVLIFLYLISTASFSLPKGFVYLHDVAPDIIEDIRYATHNNFIGNPIPGYKRGVCIVTRQTAQQLKKAEEYRKCILKCVK